MLLLVETDEEWHAVVRDDTVVRPGAEDLCARLGLRGSTLIRLPGGSQPVYTVGEDLVLKLFPRVAARHGVAEGRVLAHVHNRLPVPTPEAHACGEYENGWRYVLMSRLHGEDLAQVWDHVPRDARERLVTGIGTALAAPHALHPAPLEDVLGPGDWGAFLDRSREETAEQQRRNGLPELWLQRIDGVGSDSPPSHGLVARGDATQWRDPAGPASDFRGAAGPVVPDGEGNAGLRRHGVRRLR